MELKTKIAIGLGLTAAFGAAATVGGIYAYNRLFNYSEGTRSVYNVKFSEKGSLCKTWEGEGTMLTPSEIGGQGVTSVFKFSVSDKQKETIDALAEAGKHPTTMYTLNYRQVKWFISCMHDSEYMIEGVSKGDDANPYIMGGAYSGQQNAPATAAPRNRR